MNTDEYAELIARACVQRAAKDFEARFATGLVDLKAEFSAIVSAEMPKSMTADSVAMLVVSEVSKAIKPLAKSSCDSEFSDHDFFARVDAALSNNREKIVTGKSRADGRAEGASRP